MDDLCERQARFCAALAEPRIDETRDVVHYFSSAQLADPSIRADEALRDVR
jgi:hypothetical protein